MMSGGAVQGGGAFPEVVCCPGDGAVHNRK